MKCNIYTHWLYTPLTCYLSLNITKFISKYYCTKNKVNVIKNIINPLFR